MEPLTDLLNSYGLTGAVGYCYRGSMCSTQDTHFDYESDQKKQKEHLIQLLSRLMERGTKAQFALFFQKYHEADIAEALGEFSLEDQYQFFVNLRPEIAVEILEQMGVGQQIQLIQDFRTELAAQYLENMDPDDAVDLIEELYEENEIKAETIIQAMKGEEAEDIRELMSYEEDTAGAIMTTEFVAISEHLTVAEGLAALKGSELPETEVSFYIFILNTQKQLVGYTTLRDLIVTDPSKKIEEIRHEYPIQLHFSTDQEDVTQQFQKYEISVLPVVDDNQVLIGIITVDDIVDVMIEETTEDIYKMSGTSDIDEEKLLTGKLIYALRSRLPWLVLTILGGLVASMVITTYSKTFSTGLFTLALSLSFVPLLMGLGGNVGNQSATIFVRGLSTGLIKERHYYLYILRETLIGSCIGLILATVVVLFLIATANPIVFSIIVGASLFANLTVAALIGSSLPILFNKVHIDPAVASAPFISTTLDIIGQVIYFSLTLYVLSLLV